MILFRKGVSVFMKGVGVSMKGVGVLRKNARVSNDGHASPAWWTFDASCNFVASYNYLT